MWFSFLFLLLLHCSEKTIKYSSVISPRLRYSQDGQLRVGSCHQCWDSCRRSGMHSFFCWEVWQTATQFFLLLLLVLFVLYLVMRRNCHQSLLLVVLFSFSAYYSYYLFLYYYYDYLFIFYFCLRSLFFIRTGSACRALWRGRMGRAKLGLRSPSPSMIHSFSIHCIHHLLNRSIYVNSRLAAVWRDFCCHCD